ncbi:hypothetical protein [Streptomyces lavendofoliae]|uniref:hypothetical protein n=1 Tax=Streptomyces lavendofoliae TaxID=67314 RepID=UPI003D8FFC69
MLKKVRRTSSALTVAAMVVGGMMLSAGSASAAAYCSSTGYPEPGFPMSRCTVLGSGTLFHQKFNASATKTQITTWYTKDSGDPITAKFGYSHGGTDYWAGNFNQSKGTTKSTSWFSYTPDFRCATTVGLLSVVGQGRYQTPPANCG